LLDASVETLLLRHQVIAEPVIKHSVPARKTVLVDSWAYRQCPSNSQPGRKVGMIEMLF